MLLLAYLVSALIAYIPFGAEQRLAAHFAPKKLPDTPLQHYLQGMADRLAKAEGLPPQMRITIHYVDSDTVNAFATLGGHVVFYRGLLEKLPDENALAMVMAHEIAHVKTRAPLRSLGRGMAIAVLLGMVDQSIGTRLAGGMLGQAGLLTQMDYSRQQESEADRIGQAALEKSYGGVRGVDDLFQVFSKLGKAKDTASLELYRSHPDIAARLGTLHKQARIHGWPQGRIVPLPTAFPAWIQSVQKNKVKPSSCSR